MLNKPTKHFAIDYHLAHELAIKLKQKHIKYILCENEQLQARLKFYNIQVGNNYYLTSNYDETYEKIAIKYYGKDIKNFYLQTLK